MLVLKDKKAVVFKATNIDAVLTAIPSARKITLRGTDLVAVPHKLDETKVLRNLGYPAPSPIMHYYDWPGRYTPFDHQRQTAAFLTMHKKAIVLNEIGTGKSLSALWAADYLMRLGVIKKVLIVSPLSTLERVWGDSIFSELPTRQGVVMHGTAARRLKMLHTKSDFYIINHDGLSVIEPEIEGFFDLIIVDEAAVLRNPSTQRFKTMRRIMAKSPDAKLWLMTGTPTPNEPTDAWTLAKLLDSPELKKSYVSFRDSVMIKVADWKYIPKPSAPETVARVLTPSIRFSREQCLDLPDTIFQTRMAELTPEQKAAFKKMLKDFVVEAEAGTITAANEAVKAMKLEIGRASCRERVSSPV